MTVVSVIVAVSKAVLKMVETLSTVAVATTSTSVFVTVVVGVTVFWSVIVFVTVAVDVDVEHGMWRKAEQNGVAAL